MDLVDRLASVATFDCSKVRTHLLVCGSLSLTAIVQQACRRAAPGGAKAAEVLQAIRDAPVMPRLAEALLRVNVLVQSERSEARDELQLRSAARGWRPADAGIPRHDAPLPGDGDSRA